MEPMILPDIPLSLSTLFIPLVCGGGLLVGTLFFLYIFTRTRDQLHLAMGLLAFSAFSLVFAEGMILYFGGIEHRIATGRQFHRIEQLAGLLFIVTFPYFIGHFLKFEGRLKRVNDWIVWIGLGFVIVVAVVAFILPDLFVSQTIPHPNWLHFAGDYGRGKEGALYGLRDAVLGLLFCYCLVMTVRGLVKTQNNTYLVPMFIGLLVAMFQAVDDIQFVHTKVHIGPFPNVQYSRFAVGVSIFVILSMSALMKRYIDEAMQKARAYAALKKSRKELLFLAYHDPLTGLKNRKAFLERLEEHIALVERSKTDIIGLLILDCGGLKDLSDRLGHDVGDWLVGETAARLKRLKRRSDFLFRIDADEFSLVLTGMKDETDCAIVAEKLIAEIRKPFVSGAHTLYLVPRVGIAVYPKDAAEASDLVRNAGSALVEAKTQGNDYQYYTPALHQKAMERIHLLHSLRYALENQNFELHYQPQVNEHGMVVGAEALIRWNHPELGLIPPARFIPLAEETGLIIPLGQWIMHQACSHAKTWINNGIPIPVSVNLSTEQMKDKNLVDLVEQAVGKNDLSPEQLHIEITESSLMEDVDRNMRVLHQIREIGCSFSIDDFGTGYSSLSYLKRLPIYAIKIDRSFVIGLPDDAQDCALVRAITAMARGLNLEVVAEGVDSEAQLKFLRDADCRIIQGYFYSKPLPLDSFVSYAQAVGAWAGPGVS